MPEVKVSQRVPVGVERAWELVSDLSQYGEWLTLLEDWRGELPDELGPGVEASAVVRAKGLRNRVTFVIDRFEPPRLITLRGEGKGGTKLSLGFRIIGDQARCDLELDVEFSHPALRGPMGIAAGRAIKGDLQRSLEGFTRLA